MTRPFCIPIGNVQGFQFLRILAKICYFLFVKKIIDIIVSVKYYLIVVLICICYDLLKIVPGIYIYQIWEDMQIWIVMKKEVYAYRSLGPEVWYNIQATWGWIKVDQ